MNSRVKGRMLELREAQVWRDAGWLVEDRHPAKFIGPGRTALCDFFDKYDLVVAARGVTVYVQVSTESPSSHGPPMGFMIDEPEFDPDELMKVPERGLGVFEVYSYWRKLKGRGWVADRRWWV